MIRKAVALLKSDLILSETSNLRCHSPAFFQKIVYLVDRLYRA